MRFLTRLKRLLYNRRRHVAAVDKRTRELTEEAARVWLDAALERVPVWSGASRATFQQLASAVNYPLPIETEPSAPNRILLGRKNSRGGIERDARTGSWNFYYGTSLEYLICNETRQVEIGDCGVIWGLRNPTPWNFREAGRQAVRNLAQNADLPAPNIRLG